MELIVATSVTAGAIIAFGLALLPWHVASSLLGVAIAERLGVGDYPLELRGDLKKMSACSLVALALFLSLFYFARHPAVFLVYLLSFFFSLKVAYLGANHGFLLVILGSGLLGMLAFAPILRWLKLPGVFWLYLALFAVFLVLRQKKRRGAKERDDNESRREHRIREQARRDPEFATFCYQCLFHSLDGGSCQLSIDGEEVRKIAIGLKTYCTSFRPAEAVPPRPLE